MPRYSSLTFCSLPVTFVVAAITEHHCINECLGRKSMKEGATKQIDACVKGIKDE
jgi:hypothetical protein